MTGYTTNLDSFGLSDHGLAFNSMAVIDGVLIGLDDAGAFRLGGSLDDGAVFPAYIDTGWTDGAGLVAPDVPTEFQKRVQAVYVGGVASEALEVTCQTQEEFSVEIAEFFNREAVLEAPAPARVVPPQGFRSVFWKFRIGSTDAGVWTLSTLRVLFQNLTRRV